jgi:hypothetical protein
MPQLETSWFSMGEEMSWVACGRRRSRHVGGNQINRIKSRITFQFVRILKISLHLQLEFVMVGDQGVQQLISSTTAPRESIVCLDKLA